MILNNEIKSNIRRHAISEPNEEVCGLIYIDDIDKQLKTLEARNVHKNRATMFTVNPKDYVKAELFGNIVGIYHSHPRQEENEDFSLFDKDNATKHKVNFVLFLVKTNEFKTFSPSPEQNYIGQKFEIGETDCYSIVKNYYQYEFDIILPDFYRDRRWSITNPNLMLDNYEKAGFKICSNKKLYKNDVLLFGADGRQKTPAHMGIYLGNNMLLHQLAGKRSSIDKLSKAEKDRILYTLRYKDKLK